MIDGETFHRSAQGGKRSRVRYKGEGMLTLTTPVFFYESGVGLSGTGENNGEKHGGVCLKYIHVFKGKSYHRTVYYFVFFIIVLDTST